MKNLSVVLLAVVSLLLAGIAEGATPKKKRTRNANRVGPYGMAFVEQSKFPNSQALYIDDLVATFEEQDDPVQNLRTGTKDSDLGYQATFGFRFKRWLAAELGLAQFGQVTAFAKADMDFGQGFVPVNLQYNFSAGGPMFSVLGILPLNDRFEFFGRAGYLFTSSERQFAVSVDGDSQGEFGPKGDSQDLVLGVGAQYHFNQVYSARLEIQQLNEVGDPEASGVEDIRVIGLGFIIRF